MKTLICWQTVECGTWGMSCGTAMLRSGLGTSTAGVHEFRYTALGLPLPDSHFVGCQGCEDLREDIRSILPQMLWPWWEAGQAQGTGTAQGQSPEGLLPLPSPPLALVSGPQVSVLGTASQGLCLPREAPIQLISSATSFGKPLPPWQTQEAFALGSRGTSRGTLYTMP